MTASDFYPRLLAYCWITRATMTSGYRTERQNVAVGGVPHSAHLLGLASDVYYDGAPSEEWRREWAERLGLRLIVEYDHDHLQPADWKAG